MSVSGRGEKPSADCTCHGRQVGDDGVIGDAVARAEVDVAPVRLGIHARNARRAAVEGAVPPVPRRLPGAGPGEVAGRRVVQAEEQVALEQRAGTVAEQHDAPGARVRRATDDAGAVLAWQGRQPGAQDPGVALAGRLEVEAREVS